MPQRRQQVELLCQGLQASLDISHGPLMRAVYFDYGEGRGRLLLVIHHLVIDGVSWRIVLSDMELGWGQLGRGEEIALAAKTSSYQQWGEALREYGFF